MRSIEEKPIKDNIADIAKTLRVYRRKDTGNEDPKGLFKIG
jgi:hypothetical protein